MRTEDELRHRISDLRRREAALVGGKDWETRRARKTTREALANEREILEWVLEESTEPPRPSIRAMVAEWVAGRT